jgi:hypothetical protein
MDTLDITGQTIVFDDAYTGVEKYGRIEHDGVVHIISKEEAGPNPQRVTMKPDARIAEITGGTGLIGL